MSSLIIFDASKKSLKIKKKKYRQKIINVCNKKLFHKEYKFKRHKVRKYYALHCTTRISLLSKQEKLQ